MNYTALTQANVTALASYLKNYFDAPALEAVIRSLDYILAEAKTYTDDNIPAGT